MPVQNLSVPFKKKFKLWMFLSFLLTIGVLLWQREKIDLPWIKKAYIKFTLADLKPYKHLSFEQKQALKLGRHVTFLYYIRYNTPADAIILMPPDSVINSAFAHFMVKKNSENLMLSKQWVTYFVYPRKVIYEREKKISPLYAHTTHIVVTHGWGYEKLNENIDSVQYSVFPLKR